jgi:transcriptional regulator with XRE-family HTH domain
VSAYRLHVPALWERLERKRAAAGLTWRQVGRETGLSSSTLTRVGQGFAPDASGLLSLMLWARVDAREIALVVCGTCRGKPPAGFACLACGAEAQP